MVKITDFAIPRALNKRSAPLQNTIHKGCSFDGNQCRTPRLDEVLRYGLLVDNDCEAVFAGKQGEILKKSLWVEQRGVEPLDISKIKW